MVSGYSFLQAQTPPKEKTSGFHFEFERQGVTFPTTDLWFVDILLGLFTKRPNLHTPQERGGKRTPDFGTQLHVFTGIGAADLRHRAGLAQVTRPFMTGGFEQAALLRVATTEVITIEVGTFSTGGGSHAGIIGQNPE
jgi:hypothetical protein